MDAHARKRLLTAGGAILVVVAVVVAFVVFQQPGTPGDGGATDASTANAAPLATTLAQVIGQVTTIPAAVFDAVGPGDATSAPTTVSGSPLVSGGKPVVLYIGAEYCPYCGAQRWAMISALGRFGTFTGLRTIRSAAVNGSGGTEPYPHTPTWTFVHATYTSKYLSFTAVEMNTNIPDKKTGGYTPLQTLTGQEQALFGKYDATYQGAIPFIDFGDKYVSVGASYDPGVLSGLTWSRIAADMHDPGTAVAKAVLGAANYLTAAICGLTNDQPATACTPTVQALRAKI